MNGKNEDVKLVLREFFHVLTGALVIFAALEIIWPGVVLAYINLNWLLIFWLIVGIILVALPGLISQNN